MKVVLEFSDLRLLYATVLRSVHKNSLDVVAAPPRGEYLYYFSHDVHFSLWLFRQICWVSNSIYFLFEESKVIVQYQK